MNENFAVVGKKTCNTLKKCGFTLQKMNFQCNNLNIPGVIMVEKGKLSTRGKILYDDSLSYEEQRFICAYLFSDYLLNGDKDNDYFKII